ncbi:nitrate reductase [NADH]-like [Phoenix dactylifera]|uniref:Nitrate reductase n=1 Tax=Phoenix dactylifera TaxID=42345 RepID=A0A8B7C9P6_PHODC|nr:nitrate reductase [NADH]-like [Phoenix dactylifera]
MAASVDNRQFDRLNPGSGLGNPVGAAANNFQNTHRSNSPVRGCSFPPLLPLPPAGDRHGRDKTYHDSSDDDDDDEEEGTDWKIVYGVGSSHLEVEPSINDPRDEATSDSWVERNPSLIRLTGKHPFNCEPPLARLMHHGFITPVPLHYVRNHGAVPRADWDAWTIDITGLVKRPTRLTMDELVRGFAPLEIPVTLVCAGNRRKEQNMLRQSVGFNWGPAAVSTSVWRGARLRDVLRRCGVMGRKDGAFHVCFEGAEDLPGGGGSKYGTSLRREVAMDPSRDIMLAYMQNGELLSPDHGFPLRVIIPGFIGGRMVKWLKRIIVTPQESDNYYHYRDNRVLPSHIDAEIANSEAWWYKPEYIINELNINSVITAPGHDEILPINSFTTQRPYTMKGYAYSGGGKKVTRVEITLDGGETWLVCTLEHPEKPNKYGKFWCWCFWSVEVEVLDLLGAKEVAVRAWDETLNTQPEKLIWNVMGMMNNCWFRVKVNLCRPHRGEIGLMFEHPTQPGNLSGGWMARQKHLETTDGGHSLKKSISTPFMNTSEKQYTMSEVRKHSSQDSAWIVVHGHVYDCTGFVKDHPGGADSILINAGTDCTEEFDAIHSDKAKAMLDTYRIGELIVTGYSSDNSVHGGSSLSNLATIGEASRNPTEALTNPREKVPCRLVSKTTISRDVRLFRFALPSSDQVLGLPIGKHIFLCATIDGKLCMRPYTPTSPVDEVGHFELLIKIYFKGENPKFPNGGLMSQHLESLPMGSILDIKGPLGHIEYAGRGHFLINGKPRFAARLAMIAGGTGITPVYQVIQAVLRDQPEDRTEMHLVYANRTEDDILLRDELDGWAREHPDQLKVWYVVGEAKRNEEWRYSTGFVTESILREHIPMGGSEDTLALACGPPPMIQFAVLPSLEKMNYDISSSCLLF